LYPQTFTGLAPGIHINLVAFFLLGLAGSYAINSPIALALAVFIAAMSITHIFVDFVPSIYLGAPDEDSALSVLPGHEMLIKGKAHEAVLLSISGGLAGIFLLILLSPVFILFLPGIFNLFNQKFVMLIVLLVTSFFLFYFEKKSRSWAIILFILAGLLGIASLNLNLKEPLLPLFTGLFGASSLVTSITKKKKLPEQKTSSFKKLKVKKKSFLRVIFASLIASPFCSFLPSLGNSQAAILGSEVTGDLNRKEFLILLGTVNVLVMGLSFVTLYSINKSRTGSAVAIGKLFQIIPLNYLIIILFTILISGIAAFFLTNFLAKNFSKRISKINYSKLSFGVLIILVLITLFFSGILGFLVFIVSACLGLVCIFLNIRRTHLMGCLLLPTILYYLL